MRTGTLIQYAGPAPFQIGGLFQVNVVAGPANFVRMQSLQITLSVGQTVTGGYLHVSSGN
jgi:hypothetical protein